MPRRLCTTLPLATIEHAALAQRRELRAEFEVVVERLVGVDAQLHDRDRRVRERVHEHRPGAVVDAPAVDVRADPGRLDDVADLVGQLGQPGRGVLHVEQLPAGSRRSRGWCAAAASR